MNDRRQPKIGIDASRANQDHKTGVEWYAFFLIQELKKIQNVRIVLYSDKPLKGDLGILPENWESKVLRWLPKRLWTQMRLSWEMLVRPPDVLFIPSHVAPLIHPKKTVVTIHDVAARRFPNSYGWFERWYTLWSAKYAIKNLWHVITPSQFVKDELNAEWRMENAESIFVIPHGYNAQYRKIDEAVHMNNVLTRYNIQKPFILSVGRYEEKKNTARIIQAFNVLSYPLSAIRYQLVLVGKPGYGSEEVQAAYEHSPYRDRILMVGYIDPKDLVYIMNAADVFVFPSLVEGFGMPVLEAMACGTPVVAANGSGLEEVGADACVYVNPLNVQDIAQGIRKIIQNRELRMQNVKKGTERVRQFSWEKCARETLEVLLKE